MGSQRSRSSKIHLTWSGPTLRQFVARIEHGFGGTGASALRLATTLTGLSADEHPSPLVLRRLCSEWGLPPEDFELEEAD